MAEHTVRCARLGRELPGLDKPPFPGALGQRIYENVSKQAMAEWDQEAERLLRGGLSMAEPGARKQILKKMEEFFFDQPPPVEAAVSGETVLCVKFGKPMPAMAKPPFPGALGKRIHENVSSEGWKLWEEHSKILLNHYGLSLADPEARRFLMQQLEEFFFGEGARLPEDWMPPAAQGGKGGGGGGAKGAPGPRRK
jgi:Fe-S cluster biosynthesis and repair protein YggX